MRVEYAILGPLAVSVDGRPVDLGGSRQRAVLAVLLLGRNTVVSADRVIDDVWGEAPPPTAATALQGHVSRLRRLLGADAIETRPPGYLLRAAPEDVDADRFADLIASSIGAPPRAASRRLREALELVRGGPLADLADEPFVEQEANRLEELRMSALEARIAADLDLADAASTVPELEALVGAHPYRERLHVLRMLALYRAGRQADALAAYQEARAALDDGLGIDPGPELQALEVAILRQDPSLEAAAAARRAGSLPVPPAPLVGRVAEMAAARRQPNSGTRLLTLTGPGGIGKTRLAVEIAWSVADEVEGGAWFVGLEGATTAPAALAAIGSVLNLPEASDDDPLAPLRERAAAGPLLFVLDNLEQVPDLAGPLAELLAAAPGLRVLATSRAPLQIRAEHEQPLAPLALGSDGGGSSDAVALFLDRGRAVDPAFDPDPTGLADIARLCARLDGLPLAIELAAARVRLLPPGAILDRIERGLDVLRSERRDLPERQRSLEAAIAWSDNLLADDARRAFRRSAVFAGGFTLDAFEAVCAEPGDDALGVLDGLVRHSLVRRVDGESGEPRFALLDTIRRFALARLETTGAVATRARHARHMTERAARLEPSIGQPTEGDRVLELRDDHDNLIAALAWLRASGADEAFVALASACAPYWVRASRYREGLGWISAALDETSAGDPADRARLARHRASLTSTLGDRRAALAYARTAVEAWEAAGGSRGLGDALRITAMVASDLGEIDTARDAATRALAIATEVGDERLALEARHELAFVAVQEGDLAEGLRLLEANADGMRREGSRPGLATTLGNIGQIQHELGNLGAAEEAARESIAIVRTLHDAASLASILATLAEILVDQGRVPEAEIYGREGVRYAWRAGALRDLAPLLELMGRIAGLHGDAAGAVRLVAAAQAIHDPGAAPAWGPVQEALVPGARISLGDGALEAAWRAGLAAQPGPVVDALIGAPVP